MKAWAGNLVVSKIKPIVWGVVIFLGVVTVHSAGASSGPNWLGATDFIVNKTRELPANTEPVSLGHDCTTTTNKYGTVFCEYQTVLGKMTATGVVAPDGAGIKITNGATMLPVSNGWGDMLLWAMYDKKTSQTNLYTEEFSPSKLKLGTIWDANQYKYVPQYTYTSSGMTKLLTSKGASIGYESGMVAHSANGKWLAVPLQKYTDPISGNGTNLIRGIMLYDTTTWSSRLITYNTDVNGINYSPKGINLAVSNDGRYVALNGTTTTGNKTTLQIYDTTTCLDQTGIATNGNACEYNDVWGGVFRRYTYSSTLATQSGVEFPRHLRFNDDNSLSFQGIYGRTSPTVFSVAEFNVSTSALGNAPLGLLVMGDSYISGEGAHYYRSGTDTRDNKCHNSWLAYGHQRGWSQFPSSGVKSVACSGAMMNDIDAGLWTNDISKSRSEYSGQYNKNIKWEDKNQVDILMNFKPGYANQVLFVKDNNPRNIVLSIGGNDIGFKSIITACAVSSAEGDCYNTYKQRRELAESINSKYWGLKKTYQRVLGETRGGKLYVMGYPQVAKVGGSCGANVHLNANEVTFSRDLISHLNKTVKRAASDAGALYIDTENSFTGHRLCEAGKNSAAMNGLTAGDDKVFGKLVLSLSGSNTYVIKALGLGNESYHPTALGHKLLGATLLDQSKNFTVPMPTKTSLGPIAFSSNDAIMKGFAQGDSDISNVLWQDDPSGKLPVLVKGQKYRLQNHTVQLMPEQPLSVVMNSDPITLYEGNDTEFEISIPVSVPNGSHIISLYGTDETGQLVVVKQTVFVTGDATDVDEDGVPNEQDACVMVPQSGLDEDADGIDDACDGEIADDLTLPEGVQNIPIESHTPLEDTTDDLVSENNLLSLVIPKAQPPTTEDTAVDKASNTTSTTQPTSSPLDANHISSVVVSLHSQNSVPSAVPASVGDSSTTIRPQVLGFSVIKQLHNAQLQQHKTTHVSKSAPKQNGSRVLFAAALVLVATVCSLVIFRKTKRL